METVRETLQVIKTKQNKNCNEMTPSYCMLSGTSVAGCSAVGCETRTRKCKLEMRNWVAAD
jgi:hypothetical protein